MVKAISIAYHPPLVVKAVSLAHYIPQIRAVTLLLLYFDFYFNFFFHTQQKERRGELQKFFYLSKLFSQTVRGEDCKHPKQSFFRIVAYKRVLINDANFLLEGENGTA